MKPPFLIYEPHDESSSLGSELFFEAPHTSHFVPVGVNIPPGKLDSHEGYDIGSLPLVMSLLAQFKAAAAVVSNRSRLFVEHNRVREHCLTGTYPDPTTDEERERRLAEHYQPYVDAAHEQIRNRFINREKLPILVCVHTYTTNMHDQRRNPFNVEGDDDLVLVNTLASNLQREFSEAQIQERLTHISTLSPEDYRNSVATNGPYNLNKTLATGDINPDWVNVMSPHYTEGQNEEGYNFPWTLLETRNDLAADLVIQAVVAAAIRATVNDPHVVQDLRERKEAFFRNTIRGRPLPGIQGPLSGVQ